jgi:hypothetical protein
LREPAFRLRLSAFVSGYFCFALCLIPQFLNPPPSSGGQVPEFANGGTKPPDPVYPVHPCE